MTSQRQQGKSFLVIWRSIYLNNYENVVHSGRLAMLRVCQQNYYWFFPLLFGGPFMVLPSVLVLASYKHCPVFLAGRFPVTLPSALHWFWVWSAWQNGCDRLLLNKQSNFQAWGVRGNLKLIIQLVFSSTNWIQQSFPISHGLSHMEYLSFALQPQLLEYGIRTWKSFFSSLISGCIIAAEKSWTHES